MAHDPSARNFCYALLGSHRYPEDKSFAEAVVAPSLPIIGACRLIELVRSGGSPEELAEKFEPTAQSATADSCKYIDLEKVAGSSLRARP